MFEHGEQTFLAVDNVLRPGESAASQECALGAHASGPRVDRVLHVGQLPSRHCARTKCSRRADADGRHHLIRCEIQHSSRCDWCCERAQGSVMPAVFAYARPAHFAESHFDFVGDDGGENQVLTAQAFAFA